MREARRHGLFIRRSGGGVCTRHAFDGRAVQPDHAPSEFLRNRDEPKRRIVGRWQPANVPHGNTPQEIFSAVHWQDRVRGPPQDNSFHEIDSP
ncbi:MAG: hypothetical protein ACYTF1_15260 [Planctomycetota bacterium]